MKLHFVKKSLLSRVTYRNSERVVVVDKVEKQGAYSVEHLLSLASEGKPLPTLKSYNYMTKDSIDLSIPTHVVNDIVSLVDLSKRNDSYNSAVSDYNSKLDAEKAKAEKDAEIAKAIEEYKSSQNEVFESKGDS